jgi:hypothetical protein
MSSFLSKSTLQLGTMIEAVIVPIKLEGPVAVFLA